MKNRILLVGNSAWSMFNFRKELMLFLIKKGFDVEVAAPEDEYLGLLKELGLKVHVLKELRPKGTNPIQEILFVKELKQLYKKRRPQLIFHYTIKPNIYGTIAAHRLNIPSIAITTGLGYVFSSKGVASFFAKKLYKKHLNKANEVWFLNKDDLEMFITEQITDVQKCFLLPGEGIDTNKFSPSVNKKDLTGDNMFTFLFSGRMISEKGVQEFVYASKILKDLGYKFQSYLLGFVDVDNPEALSREKIQGWENDKIVKYLGATDNVIPFVEASDCFVFPSYYKEGIPRVLLEASSLEKPVITTDNVGCREVVDDGKTGLLCRVKDAKDLAKKMEKIINMPILERNKMGMLGRAKVINQFDQNIVFDLYLKKIHLHSNLFKNG